MDTEKQLMEQLHQLQEENQALLNGSKQIKARNRELVESYKDVIGEAFAQDIRMANLEKDRTKATYDMLAGIYKDFSGTIRKFSDIVEHSSLDARRQFWKQLEEQLSELSKNITKEAQKHTTKAIKDANKRIEDSKEALSELTKNLEHIKS
jgi:uncharacterized phage infection (PIP) family protein YhgE